MKRQPVPKNESHMIFLLDEDQGLRDMLTTALSFNYALIYTFSSESQLLHYCLSCRPDLFILDYELSERNGLALLHHLRTIAGFETIPYILLSAPITLTQQAVLHIWNLQEPFDLDTFLACVEDALRTGPSQRFLLNQQMRENVMRQEHTSVQDMVISGRHMQEGEENAS